MKRSEAVSGISINKNEKITLCQPLRCWLLNRDCFLKPLHIGRYLIIIKGRSLDPVFFEPGTERHLRSDTVSIRANVREYSDVIVVLDFFDNFFKHILWYHLSARDNITIFICSMVVSRLQRV